MSDRSGRAVLVVEDEPGVRLFVQAVLTRNGYSPLAVGSAAEALRVARESPDGIGLVISDLLLPDMDGRVLVRRLREGWPHLPVVFISGYTRDGLEMDVPDSSFVEKPFRAQDLLDVMRGALDSRA